LAALCAGLFGASALAQSSSVPATKDKEAETYNEIERGLYFAVNAGLNVVLNPPANANTPHPATSGELVELEVGADLSPRFTLSAFVRSSQQQEDSSYQGQSVSGSAFGDFTMIVPGVSARFKPFGFEDSQQVTRTWFYIRGGLGYAIFSPKALLPNSDILVFAGPGIEYYTRLRHFSIGVEAVVSLLAKSGSVGFAVTPNLRYAF
jgi:hypothetical protein